MKSENSNHHSPLILVVGDLHGDFEVYHKLQNMYKGKAAAIMLLGDVTASYYQGQNLLWSFEGLQSYSLKVYTIVGNHENWDEVDEILSCQRFIPNFELIVPGRFYEICGLRVAGMGGNYSPVWSAKTKEDKVDWLIRARKFFPEIVNTRRDKRKHFTRCQVESMKQLKEANILLFHEAVFGQGIIKRGIDRGVKVLRTLVDEVQPDFCFTSHHHSYHESQIGRTRLYSLPHPSMGWLEVEVDKGSVAEVRFQKFDFGVRLNTRFAEAKVTKRPFAGERKKPKTLNLIQELKTRFIEVLDILEHQELNELFSQCVNSVTDEQKRAFTIERLGAFIRAKVGKYVLTSDERDLQRLIKWYRKQVGERYSQFLRTRFDKEWGNWEMG